MPNQPSPEPESLCRRCARCCYEKVILDGHVFTLRSPCRFLDETSRRCRVYPERHEKNPRCLTVEQGIEWGVFPADCPYVRDLPDYHPAEAGWLDKQTLEKIERGTLCRVEDVLKEVERRRRQGRGDTD